MSENKYRIDSLPTNKMECLSDHQMTGLINNTLSAADKIVCFHHINRCSACRFCWMETANQVEDPALVPERKSWQNFIVKLTNLAHQHTLTLTTATVFAAITIFAVLLLPNTNTIESMLDEQYALLSTQPLKIESKQLIKKLSFPWENASLGFAATQASPMQLAFASGLWDGRNVFSNKSDETIPALLIKKNNPIWNTPELNVYYQLGRWMNSLWLASQFNTLIDWQKEAVILSQFNRIFQNKKQRDKQAMKTLNSLKHLKIAFEKRQQDSRATSAFRHQIEMTMVLLAPITLDE